jgi:hypothetical protein
VDLLTANARCRFAPRATSRLDWGTTGFALRWRTAERPVCRTANGPQNGYAQGPCVRAWAAVDNWPKPPRIVGKPSRIPDESLDSVIHGPRPASKPWRQCCIQHNLNSLQCDRHATEFQVVAAKSKAPGAKPGADLVWRSADRPSARLESREDRAGELVVQAGAKHVFLEADVVHNRSDAGVEAAEIDIEILDLGTSIAEHRIFKASACGPAELALGC